MHQQTKEVHHLSVAPQNSESEEEKLFSCDLKHFITLTVHFHFKASDMIEYTTVNIIDNTDNTDTIPDKFYIHGVMYSPGVVCTRYLNTGVQEHGSSCLSVLEPSHER